MNKKITAKDVMGPHSEAKVDFYQKYLERYLSILVSTKIFKEINIYDVFCGRGIYDDGGHGSPLRAFDTIHGINSKIPHNTHINLILNDRNEKHTDIVKSYIEPKNRDYSVCNVVYKNLDAEVLLDELANKLLKTDKDTRNLIFIDPYGYKYIHKETLERLMSNGYTEILLFLPITFMCRFNTAEVDNESIKPLRDFIESFFPIGHPMREHEKIGDLDYIKYLTQAFSFGGKYYTTSYHLERNPKKFFALFFFSSNLLGFNKILEVKWKLDDEDGNGFKLPDRQPGLFDAEYANDKKIWHYECLKNKLIEFLKTPKSNEQLFEYILRNEYLPCHATPILKELQNDNKLSVMRQCNGSIPRRGSFYISSDAIKKEKVVLKIIP